MVNQCRRTTARAFLHVMLCMHTCGPYVDERTIRHRQVLLLPRGLVRYSAADARSFVE